MIDKAAGEPEAAEALAGFWLEAGPDRWFKADDAFDAECRRWLAWHERAAAGDLATWSTTPTGALALVLLLDQIPRNVFRGTVRVWATDPPARDAAQAAIGRGFDLEVDPALRRFFYLPFSHAEDQAAQEHAVALYEVLGDAEALKWAIHHRDLVARFGRFPHRNAALGRASTPEEIAYLEADGFKG